MHCMKRISIILLLTFVTEVALPKHSVLKAATPDKEPLKGLWRWNPDAGVTVTGGGTGVGIFTLFLLDGTNKYSHGIPPHQVADEKMKVNTRRVADQFLQCHMTVNDLLFEAFMAPCTKKTVSTGSRFKLFTGDIQSQTGNRTHTYSTGHLQIFQFHAVVLCAVCTGKHQDIMSS